MNAQNEILEFIKTNLNFTDASSNSELIKPRELDIYIPSLNIAISYGGLYTSDDPHVGKEFHLEKLKAGKEKGIKLGRQKQSKN